MKGQSHAHPPGDGGPSLRATPFARPRLESRRLTDRQREDLLRIATKLRLPPRTTIYREHSDASSVYINGDGVLKAVRNLPSGKRRIAAFLFPRDLFGLSEKGAYVNTVQTITQSTVYRLPIDPLTDLLEHDAKLQLIFLCKVTHALREQQRHSLAVTRRDAPGRLAMFLTMLQKTMAQKAVGETTAPADKTLLEQDELMLPMSRSDIADFMGLTPESVSRACAELEKRGLVEFGGRHRVKFLSSRRLARLASAL